MNFSRQLGGPVIRQYHNLDATHVFESFHGKGQHVSARLFSFTYFEFDLFVYVFFFWYFFNLFLHSFIYLLLIYLFTYLFVFLFIHSFIHLFSYLVYYLFIFRCFQMPARSSKFFPPLLLILARCIRFQMPAPPLC
jgi:hypothetical protein